MPADDRWLQMTHVWLNLIPFSCLFSLFDFKSRHYECDQRSDREAHVQLEKQKERTEKKAKQKLMTAIWRFMGVVIEIIELLSEHWLWLVMRDTRSKWENCAIKALFARCNELARLDDGIRYSVFRKRLMRLTNEDFQAASGFVDEEDKWSIKTKFIFYFR